MTYHKPILSRDLTPVQHKFMCKVLRDIRTHRMLKQERDNFIEVAIPKCSFIDEADTMELNHYMEA